MKADSKSSVIRRATIYLLAAFAFTPAVPMFGQDTDLMTEGIMAFREERFQDAANTFERVLDQDPQNAEAHFLLARIYFETPLRDVKRAGKEIDKALELEPNNIQYLVARLEQLRTEASNFIVEKIRESKRVRLARQILDLDSTNAFAHEELGILHIRDFWRYRNAISIPYLRFVNPDYEKAEPEAPEFDPSILESDAPTLGGPPLQIDPTTPVRLFPDFDNQEFNFDDQFDLETFQSQGYAIQDLKVRAETAYARAVHHLEKSLETDPRRRSVYENLLRIHVLRNDMQRSLALLGRMLRYFPEDSFIFSNLGYSLYKAGDASGASVSFNKALDLMDSQERGVYESIDLILPDDERSDYRTDPTAYAARFWTSKDPRYLTPYNERKLEHYSRIVYADLLYSAPDVDKRGWETDRGKILIRYGLPKADVTWVATGSVNDRRVISTALFGSVEVVEFSADLVEESNRYNIWEYGDFRFVFEDPFNNGRFRFYSPPADAISNGRAGAAWLNDYEIRSKEIFRQRPDLYQYEAPGRKIDLPFLVTSFKSDDETDVYVHYGVPVNEYDSGSDVIELTANVGTFLINDKRDIVVERRKTLYGLRTAQIIDFDETHLWVSTEKLTSGSGAHDVSVEFETASGGTVAVQRRAVEIPEFPADRLALSDVLLAYRVEETPTGEPLGGADLVRSGLSIMPAPWSVFNHEQPIYLYFEVYGLEQKPDAGTDFEVEAVLAPKDDRKGIAGVFRGIFGGGEKGVSVSLPVAGSTPDDHQYLILDASNQEPGVYTLRVKVRDKVSGQSAEKEKDLFLE